jgi:hypothetical protein
MCVCVCLHVRTGGRDSVNGQAARAKVHVQTNTHIHNTPNSIKADQASGDPSPERTSGTSWPRTAGWELPWHRSTRGQHNPTMPSSAGVCQRVTARCRTRQSHQRFGGRKGLSMRTHSIGIGTRQGWMGMQGRPDHTCPALHTCHGGPVNHPQS